MAQGSSKKSGRPILHNPIEPGSRITHGAQRLPRRSVDGAAAVSLHGTLSAAPKPLGLIRSLPHYRRPNLFVNGLARRRAHP